MAASMTAILNIFKPLQLPYFSSDFDKTCIKINGLLSTLLQNTYTTYIAFPYKLLMYILHQVICYLKENANSETIPLVHLQICTKKNRTIKTSSSCFIAFSSSLKSGLCCRASNASVHSSSYSRENFSTRLMGRLMSLRSAMLGLLSASFREMCSLNLGKFTIIRIITRSSFKILIFFFK